MLSASYSVCSAYALIGVITRYEKASIVTKSTISSVRIEPVEMGFQTSCTLTYIRDGAADTTVHKITEAYTDKNPLPAISNFELLHFMCNMYQRISGVKLHTPIG